MTIFSKLNQGNQRISEKQFYLYFNHPQHGTIEVGDTSLSQLKPRKFAQNNAYIPRVTAKPFVIQYWPLS